MKVDLKAVISDHDAVAILKLLSIIIITYSSILKGFIL